MRVRNQPDFLSGLFFIAFGVSGVVAARAYNFGSAARMGPGYFPSLLGWLLIALGGLILARALFSDGIRVPIPQLRPLLLVLGSAVVFALTLESLGLVVATFCLVFGSAMAGHQYRTTEVAVLAASLIVFSVGLFVYGLGIDFRLLPRVGGWIGTI